MRPPIDEPWTDTGTVPCEDCGDESRDRVCPGCATRRAAKEACEECGASAGTPCLRPRIAGPQAESLRDARWLQERFPAYTRSIAEDLRQIAQVCVLSDDAGVRSMGERAKGLAEALDRSRDALALAESVAWK